MFKLRVRHFTSIVVLTLTLSTPAHANRIIDEWRNFRTFPRVDRAYSLLKQGDLVGARRMFEDAYQISPNRKDITLELARICAQQADITCIERLAERWIQEKPNDALGYLLKSYIGYISRKDTLIIKHAPLALQRTGISKAYRSTLAEAWLTALIRQNDIAAIGYAQQVIKQQNISITGEKIQQWKQERLAVQAALAKQAEMASKQPKATESGTTSPTASSATAQKNTVTPAPQFPYAELAPAERIKLSTAHLYALANQKQQSAFLDAVTRLQKGGWFTPALQASVNKTLENSHCDLLLAITPVESNAKLTTPYSQMAAAFCSKNNPSRAAAHFAAVNQLHLQTNEAPDLIALRGEGDALMAAGQTEQAMQRWYQLLTLKNQAQLGQNLAHLALQYPQFEISHAIAKSFPQYFPAGALALQQARQAVKDEDADAATRYFSQSLQENPDANIWYELALLYKREQQFDQQGEALSQAVKLAPDNALFHAEYGFWLISAEQHIAALDNLQEAIRLDPTRIELQPQIAFLHMQQGNREAAIIDLRASIDQYAAIQEKMGIRGDDATQQLFNWQRNVQTLEDRWNWQFNTQLRLNTGPDSKIATSPVQYGQYNGYVNAALTYRLDPIWDAARPTWIFARANQGLNDQSLSFTPDKTLGLGVTQKLLKDYMVIGALELLNRSEASYKNDIMLRFSGSHSMNTDWQPTGDRWITINLYGDAAWLARAESYYLTTSIEVGQQYRLPWLEGKSSLMPFISSITTANNDNPTHTVVSRIDIGAGIALQTWHGADPWRAPDLRQRLSLEVRQAIGGNTNDNLAVLLRWGLFH